MKILVIDDSDLARAAMMQALTKHGHQVIGLASPIGATRIVINEQIDVVVIDLQMPDVRGDRVAALFRKGTRTEKLGVVLVSGFDREELERLGKECGADAVVTKADALIELPLVVIRAYHAHRKT